MNLENMLTGHARLAGVIGWPVSHTLSPRLHGYWLRKYGIDGAYLPLAVQPDDLLAALRMLPKLGFAGANVTVPHKSTALAAVDTVDAMARRVGAVNTVVVDADGRLHGSNTDGYGFMDSLWEAAPDWQAAAGPAVVLGAGGAARGVCAALLDAGVPSILLVNRTFARAEALAADLGPQVAPVDYTERAAVLAEANLVVNTSTLGMKGQAPLDLALDRLPAAALVADIVYNPLRTALLDGAAARGNRTVDGLGMLLHQARPGFKAWFGREPEVDAGLRDFVLAGLGA